tara:strand:+ start:823 stop:954 length:132 start_codon:yes stop_codon:yes gene_type:complete
MKNVIKEEIMNYYNVNIIIIYSEYDVEENDQVDYDYDDDYMNI